MGASCSSIGPLMNEATLLAASTDSSAVLEMVSLLSSSSSTLTDLVFSDLMVEAEGCSMMSSAGDMVVEFRSDSLIKVCGVLESKFGSANVFFLVVSGYLAVKESIQSIVSNLSIVYRAIKPTTRKTKSNKRMKRPEPAKMVKSGEWRVSERNGEESENGGDLQSNLFARRARWKILSPRAWRTGVGWAERQGPMDQGSGSHEHVIGWSQAATASQEG